MSKRNTAVLKRIINCLDDHIDAQQDALERLEQEFESELLIVAGDVRDVSRHALELRLAITLEERGVVLDHISQTRAANINIDIVENAINALFDDRFMEA